MKVVKAVIKSTAIKCVLLLAVLLAWNYRYGQPSIDYFLEKPCFVGGGLMLVWGWINFLGMNDSLITRDWRNPVYHLDSQNDSQMIRMVSNFITAGLYLLPSIVSGLLAVAARG